MKTVRTKWVAAALVLALATGAWAMVGSRIEQSYPSQIKTIEAARRHLETMKVDFIQSDPASLVANLSVAKQMIYEDLPREIELVQSALEAGSDGGKRYTYYSFAPLTQPQINELTSLISTIDPKMGAMALETARLSDYELFSIATTALWTAQKRGGNIIEVASADRPSEVQVAKAEFLIDMGRIDILLGYAVILIERAKD